MRHFVHVLISSHKSYCNLILTSMSRRTGPFHHSEAGSVPNKCRSLFYPILWWQSFYPSLRRTTTFPSSVPRSCRSTDWYWREEETVRIFPNTEYMIYGRRCGICYICNLDKLGLSDTSSSDGIEREKEKFADRNYE